VYLPAIREAVVTWLDAARRIEECRRLVDHIEKSGLGNNTFFVFNSMVPMTAHEPQAIYYFGTELIREGFAVKGQIDAVFPGIIH
jgi:hypothetical protein